jgi:hypothetical protein
MHISPKRTLAFFSPLTKKLFLFLTKIAKTCENYLKKEPTLGNGIPIETLPGRFAGTLSNGIPMETLTGRVSGTLSNGMRCMEKLPSYGSKVSYFSASLLLRQMYFVAKYLNII